MSYSERVRGTLRSGLGFGAVLVLGACTGGDAGSGADAASTTSGDESPVCGRNRRPPDAPSGETFALSLVDHDAWEQLPEGEDPLAAHRPQTVDCGALGWEVEWDGFEVQTIGCNYMAAEQPTPVELCAGDQLHFDFQHFDLLSSGPAQAHAAVFVGEQALLDYTVDVDSDAATPARKWDEMIEVDDDVPAGARVYLHIHNHGFNTYKLLKVDLLLPPED